MLPIVSTSKNSFVLASPSAHRLTPSHPTWGFDESHVPADGNVFAVPKIRGETPDTKSSKLFRTKEEENIEMARIENMGKVAVQQLQSSTRPRVTSITQLPTYLQAESIKWLDKITDLRLIDDALASTPPLQIHFRDLLSTIASSKTTTRGCIFDRAQYECPEDLLWASSLGFFTNPHTRHIPACKELRAYKLPSGRTAYHSLLSYACSKGLFSVVENILSVMNKNEISVLIKKKSGYYSWSLLHWSSAHGHKKISNLLVEYGFQLNVKDSGGKNSYRLALEYQSSQAVKQLLIDTLGV